MGEDNVPELEETFQEWIDLRDDDENEDDCSSMEGISDSESGRRASLNGMYNVHDPAGPLLNRVPAVDIRADSRMVRYHRDPEHVLPSIESPIRPTPQRGHQYQLYDAPPPPAPSPPAYIAQNVATFGRRAPPATTPPLRRIDSDISMYHAEPARTTPRERQANVIDLTFSPTCPRTFRNASHAHYATPQRNTMPSTVHIGPLRGLRGGDDNTRNDPRQQAENTVRYHTRYQATHRAIPDVDGRPPGQDPFPHLNRNTHPLMARIHRGNEFMPQVATRHPPPSVAHDPPHPAVPRTGWVTFPAFNRQGEAVR